MSALESVILITAAAGVGGTGLGGIIGGLFKKDSTKTVSLLLSFAGGVMLSIVCFDLLISAINTKTNIGIIIAGVLIGIALVSLLNYIIDKRTGEGQSQPLPTYFYCSMLPVIISWNTSPFLFP